jgi:hypothetical protein
MKRTPSLIASTVLAVTLLAGCAAPAAGAPLRPGYDAVEDEYQIAVRARTVEALDLFIARHPDHPLVTKAKAKRDQLLRKKSKIR